jgi:Ca2+-binding EF-hand superfamily protein
LDADGQPKFTIAKMKEATLSIFGALFLNDHQKKLIKKIFGVMDTGGDGQLGSDEIKYGFEQILDRKFSDAEIKEIMDNIDSDDQGFIEYTEFLIASVRTDNKSFLGYMERAYESFFANEEESIETPDLIDALCTEKVMKSEFITHVTESIDEDGS